MCGFTTNFSLHFGTRHFYSLTHQAFLSFGFHTTAAAF